MRKDFLPETGLKYYGDALAHHVLGDAGYLNVKKALGATKYALLTHYLQETALNQLKTFHLVASSQNKEEAAYQAALIHLYREGVLTTKEWAATQSQQEVKATTKSWVAQTSQRVQARRFDDGTLACDEAEKFKNRLDYGSPAGRNPER
jgi:hypothetical protein